MFLLPWGVSDCSFLIGSQKLLKNFPWLGSGAKLHCVSAETFTVGAAEGKSLPFAEFVSLRISSLSCDSVGQTTPQSNKYFSRRGMELDAECHPAFSFLIPSPSLHKLFLSCLPAPHSWMLSSTSSRLLISPTSPTWRHAQDLLCVLTLGLLFVFLHSSLQWFI